MCVVFAAQNRPQAMLEAKDLPQCELSKYLENRIGLGLQKEREARAAKVRGRGGEGEGCVCVCWLC